MTEAIIVAIIVQIGLILVAIINSQRTNQRVEDANTKIETAGKAIAQVNSQFSNNGGSTAKDQLDRIETRLMNHETTMAGLTSADVADRAAARLIHDDIYEKMDELKHSLSGKLDILLENKENNEGC